MKLSDFVGSWALEGYQREESTAELTDDGPDYTAIGVWINSSPITVFDNMNRADGLALNINPDGDFVEEKIGTPDIEWFNSEGVLDSEIQTFNGTISIGKSKASLLTSETPSWAAPEQDEYEAKCRFDDGDLLICDLIQIYEGKLIRTMNVVSDEEHLYRTSLVYAPS